MTTETARDAQIAKYISALPKREEQAYAAAFAHWLVVLHGDSDMAAMETIDRAKGIRPCRSARIRRDLVERGVC